MRTHGPPRTAAMQRFPLWSTRRRWVVCEGWKVGFCILPRILAETTSSDIPRSCTHSIPWFQRKCLFKAPGTNVDKVCRVDRTCQGSRDLNTTHPGNKPSTRDATPAQRKASIISAMSRSREFGTFNSPALMDRSRKDAGETVVPNTISFP